MGFTRRISAERKHFKIDVVEASLKGISQNLVNPISKFREYKSVAHLCGPIPGEDRVCLCFQIKENIFAIQLFIKAFRKMLNRFEF